MRFVFAELLLTNLASYHPSTNTLHRAVCRIEKIIVIARCYPWTIFLAIWFINYRLPLHLVEAVNAKEFQRPSSPEDTITQTFLVAFMLATKWLQDESMPTKNWFVIPRSVEWGTHISHRHAISECPVKLLNRLEVSALQELKWEFRFHRCQWEKWLDELVNDHMSPVHVCLPEQSWERETRIWLIPIVNFYKQVLRNHPIHGGKGVVFVP
jgi:hypothetical protein